MTCPKNMECLYSNNIVFSGEWKQKLINNKQQQHQQQQQPSVDAKSKDPPLATWQPRLEATVPSSENRSCLPVASIHDFPQKHSPPTPNKLFKLQTHLFFLQTLSYKQNSVQIHTFSNFSLWFFPFFPRNNSSPKRQRARFCQAGLKAFRCRQARLLHARRCNSTAWRWSLRRPENSRSSKASSIAKRPKTQAKKNLIFKGRFLRFPIDGLYMIGFSMS